MKVSGSLQIPIRPGMREDIDQRAGAEPGTLRYAQNVRFRQMGKAERRLGSVAIGSTVADANHPINTGYPPDFVTTVGASAVVGTNGYVNLYDPTEQEWRVAGLYSSSMPVRRQSVFYAYPGIGTHNTDNGPAAIAIDSAGYMLVAYCLDVNFSAGADDTCVVRYYDPGGNLIREDEIASTLRCRAVGVGATIYLVVQDDAAANAVVEAYAYTAGARTGPTTLVTLDAAADSWDVSAWPGATAGRWLITWYDSSSTTVTVRRLNGTATEASATFTATSRLSCYANTNHAWVGTDDTAGGVAQIRCFLFNAGTLSLASTATAWIYTAGSNTSCPPFIGPSTSVTRVNYVGWAKRTSAGPGDNLYTFIHGDCTTAGVAEFIESRNNAYPISKPFGPVGEYCWADLTFGDQPVPMDPNLAAPRRAILLRRVYGTGYTSRVVVDLAGERNSQWIDDELRVDKWIAAAQAPDGHWFMPVARWIQNAIYYEVLEHESPCQTTRDAIECAGAVVTPGLPCSLFPGGGYFGSNEIGWLDQPTQRQAGSGAAGALTGNYFAAALFSYVEPNGRVSRSAPSRPYPFSAAGTEFAISWTSANTFSRRNLGLGQSYLTPVERYGQTEFYLSPPGESLLYLAADDKSSNNQDTYVTVNFAADVTTAGNRQLYTDGGALQNDLAPSCRSVVASEDRLWCGPLWDRTLWQCSKIILPQEPPLFTDSDTFKVRFPEDTECGAYLDGALVVWSKNSTYAVIGAGPSDTGDGGFGAPRCIISGLGCVNERSVQVTPIGAFFESHRGIELLPRGLGQPVFIGEPIQDQLALRPNIVDSAFHVGEDATTVRFIVEDPDALAQAFDAASSVGVTSTAGASGNSVVAAVNHTIGSGANRVLIVFVGIELGVTYTADTTVCTYNGVTMTRMTEFGSGSFRIAPFYLLEASLPATGTYSVSVTVPTGSAPSGTNTGVMVGAVSRANAAQSAPEILGTTQPGGTVTDVSTSVTVGAYQDLIDCVLCQGANGTKTVDVGQVARADLGSPDEFGVSDRVVTAAGTVSVGWDFTSNQTSPLHMVVGVNSFYVEEQGAKELVYDLDAKAWSVDDHPIDAGALGVTPLGLMFANSDLSATPAFLVEDSSSTTDGGAFFASRLTLHDFIPAGFLGITHVQSVAARVLLEQNPTTLYLSLGTDGGTPRLGTWVGTDTSTLRYYETQAGNASNQASTVQVDAYDAAGGVTWCGFVLYHEPESETGRPLAPTERY